MPKRKHEEYTHGSRSAVLSSDETRKQEVEEKLVHGKKLLNRALKTAKGFEWQKLTKRISKAQAEKNDAEVLRLEVELRMLKVCAAGSSITSHQRF
jgi:hypothetical protein